MGKIITTCPEGHVTVAQCRCMDTHVEKRQAERCTQRCSKQFPDFKDMRERAALRQAIGRVYNSHDHTQPLNFVNVEEFVEAVLSAGFRLPKALDSGPGV